MVKLFPDYAIASNARSANSITYFFAPLSRNIHLNIRRYVDMAEKTLERGPGREQPLAAEIFSQLKQS